MALLSLPGRELVGVEVVAHVPFRAHLLHPAHVYMKHRGAGNAQFVMQSASFLVKTSHFRC